MKKIFIVIVVCLSFFSTVSGQEKIERLMINPTVPVAGEVLSLAYNPAGGPLEKREQVYAIAYLYNMYRWEAADVNLTREGDIWKGEFEVPENCGFIAFAFQTTMSVQPEVVDNNDNCGFMYVVRNSSGQVMPGGNLAWGIFRMPSLGKGVPGYFKQGYQDISDEAIMMWLDKEIKAYTENARYFFDVMKAGLEKMHGKNSTPGIAFLLGNLEKEPNLREEDYMMIMNTLRFDLQQKEKADSLEKVILNKFPQGGLARRVAIDKLVRMSGEDFLKAADTFRKKFPFEVWVEKLDMPGSLYNNFYRKLIGEYYRNKQYDKVAEIIPELNMYILSEVFHRTVEFSVRKSPEPTAAYVNLSREMIELMLEKVNDNSYAYTYAHLYTPRQSEELARLYLNYYIAVHAEIAAKSGLFKEAVDVMNLLDEEVRYKSYPAGNEAYVVSLEKLGKRKEIGEALKGIARANKMTSVVYEKLRTYYQTLTKKERKQPFEVWASSLKSEEEVTMIKDELRTKIVDIPFENFEVELHNGGKLSSVDFGNSIVVLDFWALWCAPCIAALEGMQMAVNCHLDDPGVKFYFVITQDEPRKVAIDNLWKKNDYKNMEVVYDYASASGKERNVVYKVFFQGTSGIPQKVILKNGKIRYRAEGYGGSPSALMDEINYVIEILKEEDK